MRVLDGAIIERRRDLDQKLGVAHYDVRGDVLELVERLPARASGLGPNHVLAGEPRYKGGPGLSWRRPSSWRRRAGDAGKRRAHRRARHRLHGGPPVARACVQPDGHGLEELDAMIARRRARRRGRTRDVHRGHHQPPRAGRADHGLPGTAQRRLGRRGDDRAAIATMQRGRVINLSLGAYTQGNVPPIGLMNALQQVPRTSVVVAAAGNAETDVPFWPAALKQVVGRRRSRQRGRQGRRTRTSATGSTARRRATRSIEHVPDLGTGNAARLSRAGPVERHELRGAVPGRPDRRRDDRGRRHGRRRRPPRAGNATRIDPRGRRRPEPDRKTGRGSACRPGTDRPRVRTSCTECAIRAPSGAKSSGVRPHNSGFGVRPRNVERTESHVSRSWGTRSSA